MTINWGTKLTIVFIIFAGSISYMVYQCIKMPVDLVSAEYYKEEIAYQQVIDGNTNANSLTTKVELQQAGNSIIVHLPEQLKNQAVQGSILFYCSANASKDRRFELQPGNSTEQVITTGKVKPGTYMVKTNWWANKVHYYNEQPLTVQ